MCLVYAVVSVNGIFSQVHAMRWIACKIVAKKQQIFLKDKKKADGISISFVHYLFSRSSNEMSVNSLSRTCSS